MKRDSVEARLKTMGVTGRSGRVQEIPDFLNLVETQGLEQALRQSHPPFKMEFYYKLGVPGVEHLYNISYYGYTTTEIPAGMYHTLNGRLMEVLNILLHAYPFERILTMFKAVEKSES